MRVLDACFGEQRASTESGNFAGVGRIVTAESRNIPMRLDCVQS
jgi:hypothetical protein